MKEALKHVIGLTFIVMVLCLLMHIVFSLPYSDMIKSTILFVLFSIVAVARLLLML